MFGPIYEALYNTREGLYLAFDYDDYNAEDGERIIVRGLTQPDYSAGGPDYLGDNPVGIDDDFITDPGYIGDPKSDPAHIPRSDHSIC